MKKKNLSNLVALAVLLGGVTYSGSVLAEGPVTIKIGESATDPWTYTDSTGMGVYANTSNRDLGSNVDKIVTWTGSGVGVISGYVAGIRTTGSYCVTADSITNGIDVTSSDSKVQAICLEGTGTSKIGTSATQGLGNLKASTTGSEKDAYGISVKNGGDNEIFFKTGSTITAKTAGGKACGIYLWCTGTNFISGLGSIMAEETSSSSDFYGIGFYAAGGTNTITFAGDNRFIIGKSKGQSYGLYFSGGINYIGTDSSNITGSELTGIKAGFDDSGITSGWNAGIYVGEGTNKIAFSGGTSSIEAKSNGSDAYGIAFGYVWDGSVYAATGTTEVTGLGKIIAETTSTDATFENAYGIYACNGNTDDKKFSVSFDSTNGGSISAYSANGLSNGIVFEKNPTAGQSTGTSEVLNVNKITVGVATTGGSISASTSYGICAKAGVNTVTFAGDDRLITAKGAVGDGGVCGILLQGGTNYIGTTGFELTKIETDTQTGESGGIQTVTMAATDIGKITFSGSDSSIVAKSGGNIAGGINLTGIGSHEVIGLGSITSETTSTSAQANQKIAYGITAYNMNTDNTKKFSVSFDVTNGGSISAYSANGETDGIRFENGSTGTSEVKNVKTITAGVKSGSSPEEISSGAAYGIRAMAGTNTVTFTGADSFITAKSNKNDAYGISFGIRNDTAATGATTISGLGSITAERKSTNGSYVNAYGIYVKNGNTDNDTTTFSVSFDTANNTTCGNISSYSESGENIGIEFDTDDGTGKSEVKNVNKITAGVKSGSNPEEISSGVAYGIFVVPNEDDDKGVNNVDFVSGSSITAKSTGENAYGIAFGTPDTAATGTTTITGIGSITAEREDNTGDNKKAYGIFAMNGNTDNTKKFSVAFDATNGGTISAYSAAGENNGITFDGSSNGTSEVKNVKTITAGVKGSSISTGDVYGIASFTGNNEVDFKENGSITVKTNGTIGCGIYVGNGTLTVSNLGGTADGILVSGGSDVSTKIGVQGGGTLNLKKSVIKATDTVPTMYAYESASVNLSEGTKVYGSVKVETDKTLTVDVKDNTSELHVDSYSGSGTMKVTNSGKFFVEGKLALPTAESNITSNSGSEIYFIVPSDFDKDTDTMLKLKDDITIGSGVGVYVNTSALTGLEVGDVITLMDVESANDITLGSTTFKVWNGSSYVDTSNITLSGTSKLIYTVEEFTPPTPPTGKIIEIQTDGKSQIGGTASTYYSGTDYVGADGKVNLDAAIDQIKTVDAGVASNVYGIKVDGDKSITVTSLKDGISVKSTSGNAYGISLEGTGTSNIQGLGSITAETTGAVKQGYGIFSKNTGSNTSSVGFDTTDSSISVYSETGENYGIHFATGSTGTSEVKNVKTITAGICPTDSILISSGAAYGIQAVAGTNTVTFTGAGSSITAKSSGDDAYGISLDGTSTNTTTISGLGSITAETTGEAPASAYGIYAKDGENTVQFTEDGGSVFAKSTSTGAVGIKTDDGTNNISNLKSVSVVTSASTGIMSAEGVYLCAGTNTITFTGADSSITVTATGTAADAYGIDSDEDGTNIISNLGSITVETAGSGKSAYGIHMCGVEGVNTISFKGNGGQAITATNTANSANAYSIYAKGGTGTTTVNFENSILSGKVHQEGTATLNLNFNDKGTWRPKADDVTGTVAVTVNNGGSIDTRTYDAQGKVTVAAVKTVDLKDCTLTFADGAKINADAVVTNDGVTMDNFTVKAASGTISLADLNINDSAVTTAWTGVKEVDLLTGDCSNVTFTQSVVESTKYTYIFTLGSASAQKLTLNVAIEETDLSSVVSGGSDKTSYKLKKDEEVLKKDLGTLDNSKRESFTIEGDGKTLVANGYKGVTITKDTDKMYVNNITLKGFDTFATVNAGELILKNVTFTDSTTADVVNNSAHTVIIDGTVTLDKGITGEGRVVQKEGSTLEVDVTNPPDNAYINASRLDIENNATIKIKGAKEWGYYKLVSGDAAKDRNIKLWDNVVEDLKTEGFWGEFDLKDGVITMEFRNIPLGVEANTSALAGVQQGAITMVNQIADTVGENVGIIARPAQEGVYDKTIWANYINSKETVNSMPMWRGTGDNTAKYHGVTVGADFYTTKKAIAGVALTYVTGDITSKPDNTHINNKTKYYGISFYDRVTNGKGAWTYDLGYSQGKNEISQNSYQTVTADAKTNTYTLGAKYEYAYNFKHSSLVPFASLRYLRLNSKDYSNSNGHNMSINNQNLIVPKLGLAWTGNFEMPKSGWNFKPVAEVGYIWNLKGREADGTFTTRNGVYNVAYDTVDKSSYYTKLGLNFNKKNFTGGVSYRYAKGDAARQNSWNVNFSWSF